MAQDSGYILSVNQYTLAKIPGTTDPPLRLLQRTIHNLNWCVVLHTLNTPSIRLLLDPRNNILYAMTKGGDPRQLLSQNELEAHFRGLLFSCSQHRTAAGRQRLQPHPQLTATGRGRPRLTAIAEHDAASSVVPEHDDVCSACGNEFSDVRPQVCLPCGTQDEQVMFRHCMVCKPCLEKLIHNATTTVLCPICQKPYDAAQLQQALNHACLEYPINGSHRHVLQGWPENGRQRKRRCLLDLSSGNYTGTQSVLQQPGRLRHEIEGQRGVNDRVVDVTPQDYFQKLAAVVDQGQTECVLLDRIYSDHRKHRW